MCRQGHPRSFKTKTSPGAGLCCWKRWEQTAATEMARNLHFVLENNASGTLLMSRRGRKIRLHCLQITQRKNFKFSQQFLASGKFLISVESEVEWGWAQSTYSTFQHSHSQKTAFLWVDLGLNWPSLVKVHHQEKPQTTNKNQNKTPLHTNKKKFKNLNFKPNSPVLIVIIKAILNKLELVLLLNLTHQRGRQKGGDQCSLMQLDKHELMISREVKIRTVRTKSLKPKI